MSLQSESSALDTLVPPAALALAQENHQKAIPAIAKDPELIWQVETAVRKLPTRTSSSPVTAAAWLR